MWATRKITTIEEFTAAAVYNIGVALQTAASLPSDDDGKWTAVGPNTPVFTSVVKTSTVDLNYCADRKVIGGSASIYAYGATPKSGLSSGINDSEYICKFTGLEGAYSGSVYIKNLQSGADNVNNFGVIFNGAGKAAVAFKHYRPIFVWGSASPKNNNLDSLFWTFDGGWQ
jgi:hypothetical protein